MKMVLSKLFSIVVLQVLDSFQKGISSNFRSVIPALAGKTIKIGERGRQAFYYVHSDHSDGQYVKLTLSTCFYSASAISNIRLFCQQQIVLKIIFAFTKNSRFAFLQVLLIYTNREKEFRAKIFIVMRREVAEV